MILSEKSSIKLHTFGASQVTLQRDVSEFQPPAAGDSFSAAT
jgi:hypothetical protein